MNQGLYYNILYYFQNTYDKYIIFFRLSSNKNIILGKGFNEINITTLDD
jgi:hypothetical protein